MKKIYIPMHTRCAQPVDLTIGSDRCISSPIDEDPRDSANVYRFIIPRLPMSTKRLMEWLGLSRDGVRNLVSRMGLIKVEWRRFGRAWSQEWYPAGTVKRNEQVGVVDGTT